MKQKSKLRSSNSSGRYSRSLLDAAEEVFASSGYDAASIRAITRVARVPLALAHYHFKNKKELFRQVWPGASMNCAPGDWRCWGNSNTLQMADPLPLPKLWKRSPNRPSN